MERAQKGNISGSENIRENRCLEKCEEFRQKPTVIILHSKISLCFLVVSYDTTTIRRTGIVEQSQKRSLGLMSPEDIV